MQSLLSILVLIINTVWFIVLVHVIMSWLINFQVLNISQPLVRQIWYGLEALLHPIYSRIRSILPPMGGIDLAPLILLLGLYAIEVIIRNNANAVI